MARILAVVALVWLALMPPLFTGGACTAEFDHEASQLAVNQKSLATPALAQAYWSSRVHSGAKVSFPRTSSPWSR
jgi:hypothetical protein